MAKVEIVPSLLEEIDKNFKKESIKVLQHLKSLEKPPGKGKLLGNVGGIIIKELKYGGFRFYFITDGFKLKCLDKDKLVDILLGFVRMSNKKYQQETINGIKYILKTMGAGGFT
jgi:hypothetical protein